MQMAIPNSSMQTVSAHTLPIDKDDLLGGCVRLNLSIDLPRITTEISALPAELWGSRGGRVGVHTPTEAIFLRGYAPAEGDKPIEDREALSLLPYAKEIIRSLIPADAQRCLLAKLNPKAIIRPHIDNGQYFANTIRLHFPIITHPAVHMMSRGMTYYMKAGEVWALNNSNVHSVVSHWDQPRLHMICDFLPSDALIALIRSGESDLGTINQELITQSTS